MNKKTAKPAAPKRKRSTTAAKATRKTTKKTTAAKTVRKPMPVPSTTAEGRHAMIAQAAYFIAEARGFQPGCDMADWLAAERQIDARP